MGKIVSRMRGIMNSWQRNLEINYLYFIASQLIMLKIKTKYEIQIYWCTDINWNYIVKISSNVFLRVREMLQQNGLNWFLPSSIQACTNRPGVLPHWEDGWVKYENTEVSRRKLCPGACMQTIIIVDYWKWSSRTLE